MQLPAYQTNLSVERVLVLNSFYGSMSAPAVSDFLSQKKWDTEK